MTLEEAEKHLTATQRTMVNTLNDDDELIVKKYLPDADHANDRYVVWYIQGVRFIQGVTTNVGWRGPGHDCSNLDDVRHHFTALLGDAAINHAGWEVSR